MGLSLPPDGSVPLPGLLSCHAWCRMADPRIEMRDLQRMADRVCVLILSSDLPAIDIEIQKSKVRDRCLELYPDREQLYEMLYESRFQRLWEQFRPAQVES